MLALTLSLGNYMTIGDDVVIQLNRITGDRCRLTINAPREIPVVRGDVLEHGGGARPDCVYDTPVYHKRQVPWDRSKAQALHAMRKLLDHMDGADEDVQALRRQLNHMFPAGTEQLHQEVSNG